MLQVYQSQNKMLDKNYPYFYKTHITSIALYTLYCTTIPTNKLELGFYEPCVYCFRSAAYLSRKLVPLRQLSEIKIWWMWLGGLNLIKLQFTCLFCEVYYKITLILSCILFMDEFDRVTNSKFKYLQSLKFFDNFEKLSPPC